MSIRMLTYPQYVANAQKDLQWKSYKERWAYHEWAMSIIRGLTLSSPKTVLEIGSFGAGLVHGSRRMDLPGGPWPSPDPKGIIWHDAREIPWPFEDGQYDLMIALRVWHHLYPYQKEAFLEALRVSRRVLIACPEHEVVGRGIQRETFISWGGIPIIEEDLGAWGKIYLWEGCR